MLLRRCLLGSPLALLVAILAHFAGFGSSHVLANGQGGLLLGFVAAALVVASVAAICAIPGWLREGSSREACAERLRGTLPGAGGWFATSALLGGGGLAMLAAIEAAEGRGLSIWMLVPVAASSLVVALGGYLASEGLAVAGCALSAPPSAQMAPAFTYVRPAVAPFAESHRPAGARRGRAPPLRA